MVQPKPWACRKTNSKISDTERSHENYKNSFMKQLVGIFSRHPLKSRYDMLPWNASAIIFSSAGVGIRNTG
jgi:hypothetical protein